MGFVKHTQSEKAEVLSPEQHQAAEDALKRIGKTSAAQGLSKADREELGRSIDDAA